jgi:hypothetical protein
MTSPVSPAERVLSFVLREKSAPLGDQRGIQLLHGARMSAGCGLVRFATTAEASPIWKSTARRRAARTLSAEQE